MTNAELDVLHVKHRAVIDRSEAGELASDTAFFVYRQYRLIASREIGHG
jgi:hypothetical protein